MTNSKISEKEIVIAFKDNEYFRKLSPANMLTVMIEEIIVNGSINKTKLDYWNGVGNTANEVDDEEKFAHIIKILDMKEPSAKLEILYYSGLMEYCMPLCFPIKKTIQKKDLKSIVERFDKCKGDLPVRITTFLFPFNIDEVQKTLKKCNFDTELVNLIISALEDIEDFVLIKDNIKLKRFIFNKGWNYYYFIDSFAEHLNLVLDFPEYKRLSKRYLVEEIKRHHEPIFPEDLEINPSELIESGILKDDEADGMMKMLAEWCHLKPYENKKDVLLKRAEVLQKSKLKRAFRNVMWIR